MKKKENNILIIIADCQEGDYKLYKPIYKKLARMNKIKPFDIYILTDERLKNLKISKEGSSIEQVKRMQILNLVIQSYKQVYIICDSKRAVTLSQVIKPEYYAATQFYGYYTDVALVREHPITKMISKGVVLDNGVVCTTTLTPSKEHLHELNYILRRAMLYTKGITNESI